MIQLQPDNEDAYALRYFALTLLDRADDAAAAKARFQEIRPGRVAALEKDLQIIRQAQMK